jgi:hypothetical protein
MHSVKGTHTKKVKGGNKMILQEIQHKLKAPKNQRNNFGGYNYRSCEDILEALKPVLAEYNAAIVLSDSVELVGNRVYVKATATLKTQEGDISVTAFAREAETRKGMDESQITGSASSYARKYALNGLFGIDDTKDADTMDNREQATKQAKPTKKAAFIDPKHLALLNSAKSVEELTVSMGKIQKELGDNFADVRALYVPIYKKREKELTK